ncbi:MAG: cytochrome c maturation protein CcmE [Anaerolineales bacterium]
MDEEAVIRHTGSGGKLKFILGGLLIVSAVIYLIVSSAQAHTQYYLTVEETLSKYERGELDGRHLRISGAVIGESIAYDIDTLELSFTIAHVPGDMKTVDAQGGIAAALHQAVTDPECERLDVVFEGPKPDLLQDESQAIITGKMGPDGVFYADEILLKCPTKYEETLPEQSG